jgi:hypothetical protein
MCSLTCASASTWRDGSRPIQRKLGEHLVGQESIATQLEWCASAGLPRAIFTHYGTAIVTAAQNAEHAVTALSGMLGVDTQVAHDGWQVAVAYRCEVELYGIGTSDRDHSHRIDSGRANQQRIELGHGPSDDPPKRKGRSND